MSINFGDFKMDERQQETVVRGKVSSGLGEGKFFTQLTWARSQFIEKLGIDPYPGTFNVGLEDPEDRERVATFRKMAGIEIVPDSSEFCSGKCFSVVLEGAIVGAVVFPEVDDYPVDKLEIIASVNIKSALNVADGDAVSVTLLAEPLRFG